MLSNVLILAIEYFKIGCVAIGGGYTVIPFLYYLVEKYQWFNVSEIAEMIAVSNLTPGPIGINMATFVGLKIGGVWGSALTTVAFMIPSFIIILALSKFLKKHKQNELICHIIYGLRPAALALITAAGLKIMGSTVFDFEKFKISHQFSDIISAKAFILLLIFVSVGLSFRKKPLIIIVLAIVTGLFIGKV